MYSRLESSERRCYGTDSNVPLLSPNPRAAQGIELPQSESPPSNSTGSSSDGHSSNSPKTTFLTPPSPQSGRSKLHFYNTVLQNSSHSDRPFVLPLHSRPLKKHSPLNPTSLPDLPPKMRIRPGLNPLTPERYRTSSHSGISSNSSGSRTTFRAYREENVFLPRDQFHTPRSSSSLTLASDAKYVTVLFSQDRGFIPFPLDPSSVDDDPEDDDKAPNLGKKVVEVGNYSISWRGLGNLVTLILLVGAIIALFIIYPICSFYRYSCEIATGPNANTATNASTNATSTNG